MKKSTVPLTIETTDPIKLNLGCGNIPKEGYVNIDLQSNEETTYQRTQSPDIVADFTELLFDESSIDEILLSHVFEHFMRHDAVILLLRFNKWLKLQGKLELWMPDANACINEFVNASYTRKKELIRHLSGSHEDEFWSVHREMYWNDNIKEMLEACGFSVASFQNIGSQWPQFQVLSRKAGKPNLALIRKYLNSYSPNFDDGINSLMYYWMSKVESEFKDLGFVL
jgi:predicted SAM-dependent methyltransferase